jgi:hypothetical protein
MTIVFKFGMDWLLNSTYPVAADVRRLHSPANAPNLPRNASLLTSAATNSLKVN